MSLSVCETIEIASTPEHVRSVFLDFAKFPEWVQGSVQSVTPSAKGTAEKGENIKVSFGGGIAFSSTVMENSPSEFIWQNRLPGLLTSRHSFRFEPSTVTPGATTFINSEEFVGALAYITKLIPGAHHETSPGFVKFNQSLKARVESLK